MQDTDCTDKDKEWSRQTLERMHGTKLQPKNYHKINSSMKAKSQ